MIDARGLLCPMPVVKVQQAVKATHPDTLEVLVDDPCAVENISRFAASNGYTANRDTSSKPPRFIRHWRRFGDFQKPWFLAAFFGCFLSLVKESNSPKAK